MHRAIIKLPAQNTLTNTIIGHHQINGEILDVELGVMLERLTIERVQDRVTRTVRRSTGTLNRRAFTELGRVTTERTLVNLTLFSPREWHTVVLELVNRLGRFTGKVFHRIRIAEPIRPFDRVIHMPLPVIRPHIGQGRRNTTLRRNRVRACGEHFGDTRSAQALLRHAKRGAQTRAPCPYNNNVIFMGLIIISSHIAPSSMFGTQPKTVTTLSMSPTPLQRLKSGSPCRRSDPPFDLI